MYKNLKESQTDQTHAFEPVPANALIWTTLPKIVSSALAIQPHEANSHIFRSVIRSKGPLYAALLKYAYLTDLCTSFEVQSFIENQDPNFIQTLFTRLQAALTHERDYHLPTNDVIGQFADIYFEEHDSVIFITIRGCAFVYGRIDTVFDCHIDIKEAALTVFDTINNVLYPFLDTIDAADFSYIYSDELESLRQIVKTNRTCINSDNIVKFIRKKFNDQFVESSDDSIENMYDYVVHESTLKLRKKYTKMTYKKMRHYLVFLRSLKIRHKNEPWIRFCIHAVLSMLRLYKKTGWRHAQGDTYFEENECSLSHMLHLHHGLTIHDDHIADFVDMLNNTGETPTERFMISILEVNKIHSTLLAIVQCASLLERASMINQNIKAGIYHYA